MNSQQIPSPTEPWRPTSLSSDLSSTTFHPTSLSVYAQHSRGLWQPTHQSTFIIMKSTYNHSTLPVPLSNESIEPIAQCPTLEAAHQALAALVQQYPNAELMKDPEWGYLKIVGEKKTHTFWVKEVGHARVLKWMDSGDVDGGADDWVGSGVIMSDDDASGTTSDGNMSDATTLDGTTLDGATAGDTVSEDGGAAEVDVVGGLRHVFVGH